MLTAEQLAEAKAMIEAAGNGHGATNGTPAGNGWALAPAASFTTPQQGMPQPQGLDVPIKIPAGNGTVRLYLRFGPEAAASPQSIMAVLNALAAAGMPIDVYVPKNSWGGRGGNGGGWGGNRGW